MLWIRDVEKYGVRKTNTGLEELPFSGNFILTKKAINNVDEAAVLHQLQLSKVLLQRFRRHQSLQMQLYRLKLWQ